MAAAGLVAAWVFGAVVAAAALYAAATGDDLRCFMAVLVSSVSLGVLFLSLGLPEAAAVQLSIAVGFAAVAGTVAPVSRAGRLAGGAVWPGLLGGLAVASLLAYAAAAPGAGGAWCREPVHVVGLAAVPLASSLAAVGPLRSAQRERRGARRG